MCIGSLFGVTCIMWHFEGLKDIPRSGSIQVGYQGFGGSDHSQYWIPHICIWCCHLRIAGTWNLHPLLKIYAIDEGQEEVWYQYTALLYSGCNSYFFRAFTIYYYPLGYMFFRKSSIQSRHGTFMP